MYNFQDIRQVHLEVTERCNAACPQCPRRIDGGMLNSRLTMAELSVADVERLLPGHFVRQLSKVYLCGNYGDPAAAADTLAILQYLRRESPELQLGVHSNGSVRNAAWWSELGGVIGSRGYARFAIDGLAESNAIYRRNTSWEKIMENVAAFIAAGGHAEWDYIVFAHNEHEVEEARQLSERLGFKAFQVKRTARFLNRQTLNAASPAAVRDRGGRQIATIEAPRNTKYRAPLATNLLAAAEKKLSYDDYLTSKTIRCKAQQNRSLYVSARGYLLPCCWLGAMLHNPDGDETRQFAALFPDLEKSGSIDGLKNKPNEIVVGDFFQRQISEKWPAGTANRLKVCARVCGE